ENSVIEQAVALVVQTTMAAGATTRIVRLRDLPVKDCLNCRQCTGQPGTVPGECVIRKHMNALLDQIEAADGFILASPANLYTATSVYRSFIEQLMEYARLHRGPHAPLSAGQTNRRTAILISTSATPGWMGRLYYSTHQQLKETARALGAQSAGSVYIDMACPERDSVLPDKVRRQLQDLAGKLLRE
ncbi:MAG TPA: NAD(P)H-dependent oxidoreductase, partial [Gammaproteobacteria bacterium]|nr:NAD(P)H-dependent oxidoreductase [Gammaproteobacteria bacterium]